MFGAVYVTVGYVIHYGLNIFTQKELLLTEKLEKSEKIF